MNDWDQLDWISAGIVLMLILQLVLLAVAIGLKKEIDRHIDGTEV